jgi:dihydrofolate synthase/folylpolyglutamate synthase
MADFATSTSPAVQTQLDRLPLISPGGDRLGLDRIRDLLDRLGRPQDALPPLFHVAGTNGKGSTCAFLRAALEASGRSVHMFSSPHLVRFNERIRVAGALIDDEQLATLLTEVLDASTGIQPSFFEVATAVALLAFSRTPADACILEVGLGGRLDATNVVEHPLVCGIASLGLDHQSWLGRSLVEIAGEKAAIAKRGVPLVTQLYPLQVASRIAEIAADARAPWMPRGGPWDAIVRQGKLRYRDAQGNLDLPLPRLPGRHQALNAALAVAMLRHQERIAVPESALAAAMGWANWPARMEKLSDGPLTGLAPPGTDVWVDGGHNPSAARAIATYAKRNFAGDKPFVLMFASLTTKDARGVLAPFAGIADRVLTVPIHGHESRDPTDLAQLAISLGMPAEPHATLQSALRALTGPSRVLIFGSLYLAGVALAANDQLPD